ncbi:MAG: NAD-dependent deacetylase [Halobacteriales archaeon]|jgi:NAD-dependent deacetylase
MGDTDRGTHVTALAGDIRRADRVVAFTGAGVSTASGIPDFRGESGLWERYDPEQFHIRAFERDPGSFWETMVGVYEEAFGVDAEPNPAHEALAEMERAGVLEGVVTQNADRLHQQAGTENVIELHGNLREAVCQSCAQREPLSESIDRAREGDLPPRCRDCGGVVKPAGVLFGEQLPEHALYRAHALAEKADVFLAAGSSLSVEPAASLPTTAADRGATLAIVNLDPTPVDANADYTFRADVTEVLPRLADELTE